MTAQAPSREVHCADALPWLAAQTSFAGCSFITSLPDVSELPALDLAAWKGWFLEAVSLVLQRCPDDGVAIFFQSDIKREGGWVDKGYLCLKAADRLEVPLLWHKMVCRAPPGTVTHGRAAYSHMLCFSRGVKLNLAKASPDVLPSAGESTWTRGMGVEACRAACRYVLEHTASHTVVDPFCGHGTALAVANALGLSAVGVEISRKRARRAQALKVELTR